MSTEQGGCRKEREYCGSTIYAGGMIASSGNKKRDAFVMALSLTIAHVLGSLFSLKRIYPSYYARFIFLLYIAFS